MLRSGLTPGVADMPAIGELHHRATLSDAEVEEMRRTWERWKSAGDRRGYASIAALWGCGPSTARDIVLYRTRAQPTPRTPPATNPWMNPVFRCR